MLPQLPAWVVDDVASVRKEVEEWRGTTPAQRWRLAQTCARDTIWAMSVSGMTSRILSHVDPLPESSVRALERLRHDAGWGREPR
jgi:hypothetical protein